ncbi:MAG TPA: isoleucine--tRNA ligase, partial [Tepidisphaeraceae bacterium]|nr:isoleucine--tRNA ligase [Tepidisphaeraceae bacterium]
TDFAMEAKLVANEPGRLAKWREMDLYGKILASRPADKRWVLHDGPPFANGDIHIGHLINKTLKDVIIRFRTMQGYQTPYVPGWDCHGLPIEHKIQEQLGSKWREMDVAELRKLCFDYANKYVGVQSEQFQRLGILGDWAHPYLTMTPDYEASTLEVFAEFVEKGLVYKKLKPVPWSVSNQTALADAELEYKDVDDTSIYVEFPLRSMGVSPMSESGHARTANATYLLVWTTTPWTLPANLAVAVNPDVEYAQVRYERNGQSRTGLIAAALAEKVFAAAAIESYQVERVLSGTDLLKLEYHHPFIDRTGKVLPAEYVTTTDGTGLVHTAPGHGEDDYETGIKHGLEVYSPVLANGRFDQTVPEWIQGKTVWEGNSLIIEHLKEKGLLLATETIRHSYPHDWRSKKPIIFRATEQWFVSTDKQYGSPAESLRARAEDAIEKQIEFVPDWGKARMLGMIESRPDWCISRQRAWGLPIPVFYNEQGEALLTAESVRAVAKRFAEKGSNSWFTDSPAELLGDYDPGANFPKDKLRKEKDIFDVWFESGSSWHGVLQKRPNLKFPADLYLEGSDQHRGWFQLSLLPSLGVTGQPPYKQVLTHGFVVKPDGTKVSKSDKEYVTATKEIETHGADLLRLWCSSVDYQNDIPASPQALREFGDKYRKIRNTLRYLLSNLYDFDPDSAFSVQRSAFPLNSLDAWALDQLDQLVGEVTAAYEAYQLHKVFRLLHDFCAVQISAIYGNAMKDRLYCETPDSPIRQRCQTVMHRMVAALTKMLAPILVFTADEAWDQIPHKPSDEKNLPSVHLALLPKASGIQVSEDQREEWKVLMDLRDQALLQLDQLKKQAGLNKALDAEVVYFIDDPQLRLRLQEYGPDLEDMVGAGHHRIEEKDENGPAVSVKVIDRRNDYQACARSWKRRPDVGQDADYPDLSLRDAKAVRAIQQ